MLGLYNVNMIVAVSNDFREGKREWKINFEFEQKK